MALAEAKADAILSNLQTISNQEKDDEQTILTAADTAEAILQRLPIGEYVKDVKPTLLITCDQKLKGAKVKGNSDIKKKTSTSTFYFCFVLFLGNIFAIVLIPSLLIMDNLRSGQNLLLA
uniref:Uncharacterized protein n=1 Tax=Quercus lobata TaxID=97700 RepID=A0A7N2KSL7_QUELO